MDPAERSPSTVEAGFWIRQFGLPRTRPQLVFDLIFGVLVPTYCVIRDLDEGMVFSEGGLLARWNLTGYLSIVIGVALLLFYAASQRHSLVLSGMLWGSATFASLLGLRLLPLSIIGLLFVIGILGFAPFLTAFVFSRNAYRCYRNSSSKLEPRKARILAFSIAVIIIVIPFIPNVAIHHAVTKLIVAVQSDSQAEIDKSIGIVKRFKFLEDTDRIVSAYRDAQGESVRSRFSDAYRRITGEEVEERLKALESD